MRYSPRYSPSRGGHAPGHLREALLGCLDEGEPLKPDLMVPDCRHGHPMPLQWLVGQLWNCPDCFPASACGDLEIPTGSTYGKAVRTIRDMRE